MLPPCEEITVDATRAKIARRRVGTSLRFGKAVIRIRSSPGEHYHGGSDLAQVTIAWATAAGCSGINAWLASAITRTATLSPSTSFNSFRVAGGRHGSSAA